MRKKRQMKHTAIFFLAALCGAQATSPTDESDPRSRWRILCGDQATAAELAGRMIVPGRAGWLFPAAELHYVAVGSFWGQAAPMASRATQPDQADPLPAILDFKRRLDELNIELLIAPVPQKAAIYPDQLEGSPLAGATVRLDTADREFYALLISKGMAVLDVTLIFLSTRLNEDAPLYGFQDSHRSGRACVLAVGAIARVRQGRPWRIMAEQLKYETANEKIEITGDLWATWDEPRPTRERVWIRRMLSGDAPVPPDCSSPVLLLGDSHTLIFHAGADRQTTGAGLADPRAFELGFPVDVLGVQGPGATPVRISLDRHTRADASYLAGKKAVIGCFGAREFTARSGWSTVPIC